MDKPFAITLGVRSSLANHTGTWRTERPVYVDGLPPCSDACPAGEQVQQWLYVAEDGSYERAWRTLVEENPFPAVMGRVCYHPCETACNRGRLDTAVGINSVERFLGDHAIEQGWQLPLPGADTGRRVLVIGSGPCGLAAAYHLRRFGHAVEIREAGSEPGGMMRFGIPEFRLPREVLDAEIARLLHMGVTLRLDSRVDDIGAAMLDSDCDAALLAIGAQLSKRAYIPAGQTARILDALTLLGDVAGGGRPYLGRRVVVYGGGNTAMDAARTARRLGADEALVVYRRTRERMPANDIEVDEAVAEGVQMRWLSTIAYAGEGTVTIERMELDEHGMPQPTGEFDDLAADAVVLALGQDVDGEVVRTARGVRTDQGLIEVDGEQMTGLSGVFAGGDATPSARSVTAAIGHGKKVAGAIDRWLRSAHAPAPQPPQQPVPFARLNTWYFSDAPHAMRPRLDAARRTADFSEVVGGLDESTALYEARRCLSCGNCFGCDNCYGVCPDNAVRKTTLTAQAHGYEIDYDYCKGCGMCVAECPAGAIVMEPEEI
jgi:NADPH-dependent glutamate synthase beta subunit-like oxidoreductase